MAQKLQDRKQTVKQSPKKTRKKTKRKAKEKAKRSTAAIIRMIAIIAVILVLLFIAAQTFGKVTLSQLPDAVKSILSGLSSGDGYPYSVSSSSIKDIKMLDSNLFLLTDTSTITLDSSAKEVSQIDHTYSSPAMDCKNSRAIVYDRGGTRFRVQSKSEQLYKSETDYKIITCAIGKKGNIAIATLCKDATSMMTVYDANFTKKVFEWKCNSEHIVDIALSDNGKCAAVAVLGASGGEIYSKLYIFNFDYSKPLKVFTYKETTLFDVNFNGRDNIIAMGDNLRSTIKNYKEKQDDIDFGTSEIKKYCSAENGMSAMVLSKYGSTNSNVLTVFDDNGDKLFEKSFDSAIRDIYCSGKTVSVLLDNRIIIYSKYGNEKDRISSKNDSISILSSGRYTYIYAMGEIRQYT